jgi:hypothetical protein
MASIFTNKQTQAKKQIQGPSDDEIAIAQSELVRTQQQVEQQHELINQQQQHLHQLSEVARLAQSRLAALQTQKTAVELEQQQSEFTIELRSLAEEINELSWVLGQRLQQFNARINSGVGLELNLSKRITTEGIDLQFARRHPTPSSFWLPIVWNQIGSDRFSLSFRSPLNPDEPDRLAALRKIQGKSGD